MVIKKMPIKINLNEYLTIYLVLDVDSHSIHIEGTNCPEEAISIIEDGEQVIVKCCNKEVATINLSNGKTLLTNIYITTDEVKNFVEDLRARGYNTAFRSNREMFEEKDPEVEEYPIELHTHFMEVLSGVEFLELMSNYLDKIPVNSSNRIVDCPISKEDPRKLDESKVYKWIDMRDALTDPAIIEQLRVPVDRQVAFRALSEGLAVRNSLIDLASYYRAKSQIEEEARTTKLTKAGANDIKSKYKLPIFVDMLITSIETLKAQGIKYVEFSYSNHNTLRNMLNILRTNKTEGITVRFLLSENRSAKAKLYRRNSREVKALLDEFPEVVGFDLMGMEQEIMPSEYENTGNCRTLYDRLRFTIENLLASSREKPTLRLHSGEILYTREGSPNNNPQFILEILKQIEEDLGVDLADKLNIRIGHGLHFQPTNEYFNLLKHFNVIVEICASSNFALGNVMDLSEIPYKEYEEHGIPFVIATDGGGFYLTTLKTESKIAGIFGGDEILKKIQTTSSEIIEGTRSVEPVDSHTSISTIEDLYKRVIEDHQDSHFIKEFVDAPDKDNYILSYFRGNYTLDIEEDHLFPEGINEHEKVKMEFNRLQAFYHDKAINELYFTKEQEEVILRTFDKIEEDIKRYRILDAASSIYALQQKVLCESRINKIALYIHAQNKELKDYLIYPERKKNEILEDNKLIIDDNDNIDIKYHEVRYYINDILSKKSELRDNMLNDLDSLYKKYFTDNEYHLDIPERGYFNIDESEEKKLMVEIKRTLKYCANKIDNEYYNSNQENVISETFYMINKLLDEENYLEAASYLVSLQTVLGMKVKLETAYVYMAYNHKEIEDYINIELFQEKTKGRGKTK